MTTAGAAEVLDDRAVGLLAVASAVAVANAYYIQPLLVEVSGTLSIPSYLVGILPALSQIGLAGGLTFILPLGDVICKRQLMAACASLRRSGLFPE